MGQAYIFRGPPAAGKGTLVYRFAEKLDGKVAYLDLDVFRWGFHLIGRPIEDVSVSEHRFAFDNLLVLLERYCKRQEYTLVVDGLFTWDDQTSSEGNVQAIIRILDGSGYAHRNILLTAAKEELEARNRQREHAVPSVEFNKLYQGVMGKIGPNEITVDSTGQTPDQTLLEIEHAAG